MSPRFLTVRSLTFTVLAVTALALALTRPAHAGGEAQLPLQPDGARVADTAQGPVSALPPPTLYSPSGAQATSILVSLGSLAAGTALMTAQDDGTAALGILIAGMGGLAVGPSAGYFATGQSRHGLKMSAVRTASMLGGLIGLGIGSSNWEVKPANYVAFGVLEAATLALAIWDIGRLPGSVRAVNTARAHARVEPVVSFWPAGPVAGATFHF